MSVLAGSIDPLEVDLFIGKAFARVDGQRLAQSNRAFLRANAATTDHDKVLLDQTVMREATLEEGR